MQKSLPSALSTPLPDRDNSQSAKFIQGGEGCGEIANEQATGCSLGVVEVQNSVDLP